MLERDVVVAVAGVIVVQCEADGVGLARAGTAAKHGEPLPQGEGRSYPFAFDEVRLTKIVDMHVWYGDVGLAAASGEDGFYELPPGIEIGVVSGTPAYMSPEQCQGQSLDPRSDIYSIGILLYEILTGTVPFDGESTLQVVYNQLHLIPRSIKELSPDISEPLAKVIMRALEKEPNDRQASAMQLSDELKQAVKNEAEESSYSMAEPFLAMPLTPHEGRPSGRHSIEEHDLKFPSLGAKNQSLADRSTAALGRPGGHNEAETRIREQRRPTNPDNQVPTLEKRPTRGTDAGNAEVPKPSRLPLLAGAAVVLLLIVAAAIYFSRKDEPGAPTTPKTVSPPTGMALIQGGKFMMGRDDGSSDEGPVREVEIKSFFLDQQEVTNQDYKKFVDATGHPAPRNWKSNGSYAPDEGRFPVAYVTWDDAAAYAKWAGRRLPSEAEWEYAARGGKGYVYPWGNQWVAGYANVDRKGQLKPAPVRSFEKDMSPFGIYDLAGNVSEWVQDNYSERYGAKPDTRLRVYRGGNFLDAPDKGTNTYRWADYPNDIPEDQILRVGFRCAKDIE